MTRADPSLPQPRGSWYSTKVQLSSSCWGLSLWEIWVLAMLAAGVASCEQSDVGKACPGLLEGANPLTAGDGTQTAETVGQSVEFPCEELICVASDGHDGYCTKKCRADDAGACPLGFECRVVQQVEGQAFYDEGLCVWQRCDTDADCAAPGHLECECSYEIDLGRGQYEYKKQCNFIQRCDTDADCGAPDYLECKCSKIDLGGGASEFAKLCNFVDSPCAHADTVEVDEEDCANL